MTGNSRMAWQTKEETENELAEMTSTLNFLEEEMKLLQIQIVEMQNSIRCRQAYLSSLQSETSESDASIPLASHLSEADINSPKLERTPMEMLRSQYKGMKLADIAATVLTEKQVPLTTTELSHIIYDIKSDDELYRARNSLSGELRTGAKKQNSRWHKVGRYAYASVFPLQLN